MDVDDDWASLVTPAPAPAPAVGLVPVAPPDPEYDWALAAVADVPAPLDDEQPPMRDVELQLIPRPVGPFLSFNSPDMLRAHGTPRTKQQMTKYLQSFSQNIRDLVGAARLQGGHGLARAALAPIDDGLDDDAFIGSEHGDEPLADEGDGDAEAGVLAEPVAAPAGGALVIPPAGVLAIPAPGASDGVDGFKAAAHVELLSQVAVGGMFSAAFQDLNSAWCRQHLPPVKDAESLVEEFRQADSAMTIGRAAATARRLKISPKRVMWTTNCQAFAYLLVFLTN